MSGLAALAEVKQECFIHSHMALSTIKMLCIAAFTTVEHTSIRVPYIAAFATVEHKGALYS